jgi:hypothetical protein
LQVEGQQMNPSYCRIHVARDDALRRFAKWRNLPKIGPLAPTDPVKAVDLACDERGSWRGNAIFVSEVRDWTLFYDLSGSLGGTPSEAWCKFAGKDDLVFAGYNDAIGYAELVVVSGGRVIREFFEDKESPELSVNKGTLDSETTPIVSWIEVASFVDDDELGFSDTGWLWVF